MQLITTEQVSREVMFLDLYSVAARAESWLS
jgi:hypothetical protein